MQTVHLRTLTEQHAAPLCHSRLQDGRGVH